MSGRSRRLCGKQENQHYRKQQTLNKALGEFFLYTQRNLFEILLNQTEIRLYLPFSD